jgi:hypothetical protein
MASISFLFLLLISSTNIMLSASYLPSVSSASLQQQYAHHNSNNQEHMSKARGIRNPVAIDPEWVKENEGIIKHELQNHTFGFIIGQSHSGSVLSTN